MRWHEHFRRGVKVALAAGLHYSGVLSTIRARVMRDQAVVLMYHRVRPKNEGVGDYSPNGMTVTPREFRMQMEFIRKHYDIVTLSRIVAAVREEAGVPPRMCAVTFDDGWRDVYLHAFPVLKDLSIPATVFLTGAFSADAHWHWEERMKFVLASTHRMRRRLTAPDAQAVRAGLANSEAAGLLELRDSRLPAFLAKTARRWRSLDSEARRQNMDRLERLHSLVAPDAPREYLEVPEIVEMGKRGVEFGNHSTTHANLCECTPQQVLEELRSADSWISEATGVRPTHVAYPYGKFNASVRSQVMKVGYAGGFTTRFGLVARGTDHLAINRVNMCSELAGNEPLFAARILGF